MQLPDEIEEVKRVALRPGDIVVLRSSRPLSPMLVDEISERLSDVFPGHKIVVLEPGMDLEVAEPVAVHPVEWRPGFPPPHDFSPAALGLTSRCGVCGGQAAG